MLTLVGAPQFSYATQIVIPGAPFTGLAWTDADIGDAIDMQEGGTYAVPFGVAGNAYVGIQNDFYGLEAGSLYTVSATSSTRTFIAHPNGLPPTPFSWQRAGTYELDLYAASDASMATITTVHFTIQNANDPCATPGACHDSVLFLPGIEGSRLYEGNGCGHTTEEKLWEPVNSILDIYKGDTHVNELDLNSSGQSICADIYTKPGDIVDSVYHSFETEMDTLVARGTIQAWEPVAYDWRLSLSDLVNKGAERNGKIYYADATSTPYIEQTLRQLAANSQTGRVTIIAHSNGGLVAKALLQKLGGTAAAKLVDKVILVAAPQDGTPADIGSLLLGYQAGIYAYGSIPIVSNQAARAFAQNSPMAYHLLPSAAYVANAGQDPKHPLVSFEGSDYQRAEDAYGSIINTIQGLTDFLVAAGGDRTQPSAGDLNHAIVANPALLSYATSTHATLDTWVPPAGIMVDQIAGWGVDTVGGIDFYTPSPGQRGLACAACATRPEYRPIFIEDGDGTVTAPSALMMASSTSVKSYWVNLNRFNKDYSTQNKHADILEIPQLAALIDNILTNSTSSLPAYISTDQPPPLSTGKKLTFFLHSPLSLQLTDASGNTTGVAPDGSTTENIPSSTYGQFGEVKYIIAPEGSPYTLSMHGLASGTFSLDIEESSGDAVTASSTIANVPTTANTTVTMRVTSGISTLSPMTIDENGDGTIDATVTPKLGQTVVFDTVPPELQATFSTTTRAIVWSAIDNSGSATVTSATSPVYASFEKDAGRGGEHAEKGKKDAQDMRQKYGERHGLYATMVTARDATGNTTVLSYTQLATPFFRAHSAITLQSIAYNGATTTLSGARIAYYVAYNRHKNLLETFVAALRTASSTVVAVYEPRRDKTVVTTRNLSHSPGELKHFDRRGVMRHKRQTLPGLVIPYIQTEKGSLIISY
ncbi:MAG TPA: alpha/beta hydrolase [Candidatus Paceibacterota bacterium]|nr:alpha/beta hydrolase [Candidatus Paceibacterota bacterium]